MTNGLVQNISYADYHNAEGFRSSYLNLLRRSPAHFKAKVNESKTSPAMEFGRIFHYALENGERFLDMVKVEPEFIGMTKDGRPSARSKDALDQRKAWQAAMPEGSICVSQESYDTLLGMLKAMNNHRVVKNMIKDGVRESSGFVKCPETGLMLKFRPDLITPSGFLVDYKSARDARYFTFHREIFSDREPSRFYILSAAHYTYCQRLLGLSKQPSMTYIAVEKEAPYGINVFPLDEGCLEVGERLRAPLMRAYAECLETDTWPGYEERALSVFPPEYDATFSPDVEYLYGEHDAEA